MSDLYLGQNIVVTDNQNSDGTYSTILNAPDTTIIEKENDMAVLSVTQSANFNGITINNLGNAVADTDATNLKQVKDLVLEETNRASLSEQQIGNSLLSINDAIAALNNKLDTLITEDLLDNLSNEVNRATSAEQQIRTDLTANLTSEVNRATSAEQQIRDDLSVNLTTEVDRATSAEQQIRTDLSANLTSEVNRATSSELQIREDLTKNLNSQVNRLTNYEMRIYELVMNLANRIDYLYARFYRDPNMGKIGLTLTPPEYVPTDSESNSSVSN